MIAIYPGSFNPPTLGHEDIIRRAAGIFDGVVVAVMGQSAKKYRVSPEARAAMLRRVTAGMPNVRVVCGDGLTTELARREGADVILRGVRDASDLPFEMQLAGAYRRLSGLETVLLPCSARYGQLSSSIVRDCALHGAPLDEMVPEEIKEEIFTAYGNTPNAEREC